MGVSQLVQKLSVEQKDDRSITNRSTTNQEEIVTKTIFNRVNKSHRGGHFVIGPVLFPAVYF